ncbi:helix-turn-helix transcriptional regulator [Janthinobacterium svalbardensis]|uniref:helix-turn-helix transcriptional regulator n=1 Tax=Janthinobacterium svalbardensis TaxID=368607 RepID=UPI002FCDCEC8
MDASLTARQQALIARLYDAALNDALWPQLCRDLADACGGASDAIVILESDSGAQLLSPTRNFDDTAVNAYEAYYWQHDVWAEWAFRLGMGQIHASDQHIPPGILERTEFYADFCRPHGLYHVIGTAFSVAPGEVALLGVHRQRTQGPFADSSLLQAQLQALLPHLQRALRIRSRLAHSGMQERTTRAALDALDTAVLLVDSRLDVLYANASALALFGPGLERSLHCPAGGSPRWCALPQLAQAVRQAIGTGQGKRIAAPIASAVRLPRPGAPDLCLTVAPFQPQGQSTQRPCALVLARDPQAPPVAVPALQQLFDLTQAEALVAQALAQGAAIDRIAADTGVSINTVRTHLHHIYDKTGTARQGELIAKIHQGASPFTGKESPP